MAGDGDGFDGCDDIADPDDDDDDAGNCAVRWQVVVTMMRLMVVMVTVGSRDVNDGDVLGWL